MEILCHYCQGTMAVKYTNVYKLDEDYFVTYCIGCGSENEVWDVYDWFEPEEIAYIERYNDESSKERGWQEEDDDNNYD